MICVSIGRSRHKHMLLEHKHLVEQGAELVELRLDYISTRINLKRLVDERPCPVIVTCRRDADGGKFTGDEDARLRLLREAIVLGVEYVDLEDDVAANVPRFGKTKRIVSHHNFRNTPEDLEGLHAKLAGMDADVVKIATMAQHPDDNLRMLELVNKSDIPTVGMCMGDIGMPSRILAAKYGAPWTYATFHHERALAPGQLSYDQMVGIYRHGKINAETDVYGVIADPVAHSLSPHVHNAAFEAANINAVYVPFRVPPDDLQSFIQNVPSLGIKGLSVTIPHKERIAKCLTKIGPAAKGIAAVNTVLFRDGEVIGANTDFQAAMDAMEHALGGENSEGKSPLEGKRALILGAGGVSRAVAYGLSKRNVRTIITSRTRSKAEALAKDFGAGCVEWESRHLADVDLLINGTPIGMHPNVDECPVPASMLHPGMLVFDTVYNPESTLLIKQAREHGATIVTGVEMFERQAELQFQLFTEQLPPKNVMRETLKRVIGPVKF